MTGPPQKSAVAAPGRGTLAEDPRRKPRNVRDKSHQNECINAVLDFLAAKEYDRPISVESLNNPSLKEFQAIFRFIYSHIDANADFTRKFEEEVVLFLRGIRYPYASEINRSQLLAVTPHTWPVLVSMLAWLVALIQTVEGVRVFQPVETIEDGSKKIFYHYLYHEYSAYMEGRDGDSSGEQQIQRSIAEINQERLAAAQECADRLDKIKKEIGLVSNSAREVQELESEMEQVQKDLEKLVCLKKNNELQHRKYSESLAEAQAALQQVGEKLSEAYRHKARLEEEIKLQPIKPEDVEEMTEERDFLLRGTEELKQAKTALIKEIEVLNQQAKQLAEQGEKLLFDMANISSSLGISLKLVRHRILADLFECDEYELEGSIEEEHGRAKTALQHLAREASATDELLSAAKEKLAGLQEKDRSLAEEICSKEKRAKIHAQIYTEKKEASEEEYRRAVGRVEKAETELLKILADGDNGLFQSEQALERLKIRRARLQSQITA